MSIDFYLNRIICGDCLTVMREMPDESVDWSGVLLATFGSVPNAA